MAMLSVFISLVHPARTQELKETRFSLTALVEA